jgi:uncharacterized protein (TIGR02246 family)
MPSDSEAIKATLNDYRDALVSSNVDPIVKLYAKDGVTMAQNFQTQIGHDAIREWYTQCFKAITLIVEFEIKEVVLASDEYAFARTSSSGTQKVNQTGQSSKEANQELFVMQKVDGEWKIARYCFCTMNPAK